MTTPVRRRDRPWRTTLGQVIVARSSDDVVYLGGAAAALWEVADTALPPDEQIDRVLAAYPSLTPDDATEALELLRAHDLVEDA